MFNNSKKPSAEYNHIVTSYRLHEIFITLSGILAQYQMQCDITITIGLDFLEMLTENLLNNFILKCKFKRKLFAF